MNVAPKLGHLTTFMVTSAFLFMRMCRGNVALAACRITTVFISNAEYGIGLKRSS